MILNIAVCEDMQSDRERLLSVLNASEIPSNVTAFASAEEFINVYRPQMFDLLLTDIYMDGMTGVDAVAKIREIDENLSVAIITSSSDFALESYRLSVVKYIEKPFSEKEIEKVLKYALLKKKASPSLDISKNGKEDTIPLSEIMYVEQKAHQLYIYSNDGEVAQIYERLSSVLPQLEEHGFFNCHKSYAANLKYVEHLDTDLRCFVMKNGVNIPIRRESMGKAKKAYQNYIFEITRGIF